jgi:predicted ATPase
LIELAEKYNFPPMVAHAVLHSGWARAVGPDIDAGLAMMEAAYPKASAAGPTFRFYAALLASARLSAGRASEALEVCRWALDTVTEPGVGLLVPELHRLQGASLLRLGAGHEGEAMQSLQVAMDVAKQQGAPLLQLRAALTMAEAEIARGRLAEGQAPLRAVCANLPPECDVPELEEAKRLLAA